MVAALYTIAVLIIQPHWLFVEIGFFAMLLLMGITFPAISSLAMESERQYAGSASALIGCFSMLLGACMMPVVGIAGDHTAIPMGVIMLTCYGLGMIVFYRMIASAHIAMR